MDYRSFNFEVRRGFGAELQRPPFGSLAGVQMEKVRRRPLHADRRSPAAIQPPDHQTNRDVLHTPLVSGLQMYLCICNWKRTFSLSPRIHSASWMGSSFPK